MGKKLPPPRVRELHPDRPKPKPKPKAVVEACRLPAEPLPAERVQLSLLGEAPVVEGRASDECYTPRKLVTAAEELLEGIDTDPCWSPRSLVTPRVAGYTIADDGLSKEWHGSVWLNPPYSGPYPFMERACAHAEKGHKILAVLNVDPSTAWWAVTYPFEGMERKGKGQAADYCGLYPERLCFLGAFAKGNTARSASALFAWNIAKDRLKAVLPRVLWYQPV